MVFLFIRFLPYFVPICYLVLLKVVFYYSDWWILLLLLGVILDLAYFALLKYKNPQKPILGLAVFSLIYYFTGSAFVLILENNYVINSFLLVWSLIFWLYLEAIFHDFYETTHTHIINLQNISLYVSILSIFFLTCSLISFNIFLNWPNFGILIILGIVYLSVISFTLGQQQISRDNAWLHGSIISLILIESLLALMFLPVSFYVTSVIVALVYYFFFSITLLSLKKQLTNKLLWRYLAFCLVVALAVFLTATWF